MRPAFIYFDMGNVVPVGSMNQYASQHFTTSPVYASTAEFYGEGVLPAHLLEGKAKVKRRKARRPASWAGGPFR